MNMKYLKYYLLLIVSIEFYATSCTKDKLLEVVPNGTLSGSTFWKTKSDADLALAGCYRDWEIGMNIAMGDAMADNDYSQLAITGYENVGNGSVTPQNVLIGTGARAFSYSQIRKYNNFLENIDNVTMADSLKEKYKAEVRFLRAYDYFLKVQFFGDMPLITQTTLSSNLPSRTPVASIDSFILNELAAISKILPVQNLLQSKGHMTSGSALALKARLELFMGDYVDAMTDSKAVIDMGVYHLFPNYEQLFWRQNNYANTESIAEIQYVKTVYFTSIPWQRLPAFLGGYAESGVSKSLVDTYETTNGLTISEDPSYDPNNPFANRDPRLDMSIAHPGSFWLGRYYDGLDATINGITNPDYHLQNGSKSAQMGKKYLDPSIVKEDQQDFNGNIIVIRLAEMYLTYAEAAEETGTNLDLGLEYINKLRDRVGLIKATTLSRDLVRRERRVELAFEGLRYYDVKRWDLGPTVMNGPYYGSRLGSINPQTGEVTWGSGYILVENRTFHPERKYLLPIPQSELDVNPNMTQNPGY